MNSLPSLPLGIFGLGTPEIIGILAIVVLLFGATKLPALAKGLGQSVKEFKKAQKDESDDPEKPAEPKPTAPAKPPAKTNDQN